MKKQILFFFCCYLFSSCEVYKRYYVYNSKEIIPLRIKVNSKFDLPKKSLFIVKDNIEDSILVDIDSLKCEYSFSLLTYYTVQLFPTTFGKPAIEYIIINEMDTLYINTPKSSGKYKFKKMCNQKFLLNI